MKPTPRTVLLLVATLALAACGFHLRKGVSLPADLGPLQVVSASRYSPLAEALAQALARGRVTDSVTAVASKPGAGATPTATLNIRQEKWGNLPVSVDARGRAQEQTLRYAVEFDLRRADGSVLVPSQVVELGRNYVTVPNESTGTDSEQETLAKEMRRDMVASIMRRIDAALQATNPAPQAPAP